MKVIAPLHGIRTTANWHRILSDTLQPLNEWQCDLTRWYYGRFSLLRFLLPWQRSSRIKWFRQTYDELMNDRRFDASSDNLPSIVAHSFGTYILGHALAKFPHIKFDRVILCGSILPRDFPWDHLLARGQVKAVRNEYGAKDIWSDIVPWFVRGAGSSGKSGFTCRHPKLFQQRFSFEHSDYFNTGHISTYWLPFISNEIPRQRRAEQLPGDGKKEPTIPWGVYLTYALLLALLGAVFLNWERLLHEIVSPQVAYEEPPPPGSSHVAVFKWVSGVITTTGDRHLLVEFWKWEPGGGGDQYLGTDVFLINRGNIETLKFTLQGGILLPSPATPTPPEAVIVQFFADLRHILQNTVLPDMSISPSQNDVWNSVLGPKVDDKTIAPIKAGKVPVYTLTLMKYTDHTVPAGKFIYTETCVYSLEGVIHFCHGHDRTYMSN
jgi:pimeloyl-ACP methyl ester carboxylesterase